MNTSALSKIYIRTEVGSAWTRGLFTPTNVIVICELTPVEFFSALARRERRGEITPADTATLRTGFLHDYTTEYLSVALETSVMVRARNLFGKHPLRALDAVQLSAALEFEAEFGEPVIFLTADNVLLTAAKGEGLSTDNPLNHP